MSILCVLIPQAGTRSLKYIDLPKVRERELAKFDANDEQWER